MRFLALAASLGMAGAAHADVPVVATDIAPVHSLVARVMEGVGSPALIVRPGASPHGYVLRPSEAGALEAADLVVMMGGALTPGLVTAAQTLTPGATTIYLLESPGIVLLDSRDEAAFTLETTGDGHNHDHDHDHDHDHAEGGLDPHAWLDPSNAVIWLEQIAQALAVLDTGNAAAYVANAADGQAELVALSAELDGALVPARAGNFVVFHDAYQYFETRFGIPVSGAISLSDASDPSAARIAAMRDLAQAEAITCALAEPQFNPGLVATIFDGTATRTGVIDPLGADIPPGPDFYPDLIRAMAETFITC